MSQMVSSRFKTEAGAITAQWAWSSRLIPTCVKWSFCVLAMLVVLLPASANELRDAHRLYTNGDFTAAEKIWSKLAANGDADAYYSLGQLYRRGEGVEKNLQKAREYYLKAAELGQSFAQSNLGTLYFMDEPPNMEQAIRWWTEGASNGEVNSQYRMGVLYFNGDNLPVDRVRGYSWMLQAEKQGHEDAQRLLGEMAKHLSQEEKETAKKLMAELIHKDSETLSAAEPDTVVTKPAPNQNNIEAAPLEPARKIEKENLSLPVADAADKNGDVGSFTLQFGAFGSRESAEALWNTLRGQHVELLQDMSPAIVEVRGGGGKILYRLQGQAGFTDRETAVNRCEALKKKGATCFVATADPR